MDWLGARENVKLALNAGRSVNLIVKGEPDRKGLVLQLREDLGSLAVVDLASGATASRQSLVTEIFRELGRPSEARKPPNDLTDLHRCIMEAPTVIQLAFRHFDQVKTRRYTEDFYSALKHLVEERKLVLMIESRVPFSSLLPPTNSLSRIQMKTVELNGRIV